MIIRITKPSPATRWYNEHVGEEFEVLVYRNAIPNVYEVDVSELKDAGRLAVARAFVQESDLEIVEPESPWYRKYTELADRLEDEGLMEAADTVADMMAQGLHHLDRAKYPRAVLEDLFRSGEISAEQRDRLMLEIVGPSHKPV